MLFMIYFVFTSDCRGGGGWIIRVSLGCFWATNPALAARMWHFLFLKAFVALKWWIPNFFFSCCLTGTGRWSITPSFRNQMMLVNDFFFKFFSLISLGWSSSLLPCILIVLLLITSSTPIPRSFCSSQPELLISVWKYNDSHMFCVKQTMVIEILLFNAGIVAVPRGCWQQCLPHSMLCSGAEAPWCHFFFSTGKDVFHLFYGSNWAHINRHLGGIAAKKISSVWMNKILLDHIFKNIISVNEHFWIPFLNKCNPCESTENFWSILWILGR